MNRHHKETLAKRYKSCNIVIPRLDRGIQCFERLSGFPGQAGE